MFNLCVIYLCVRVCVCVRVCLCVCVRECVYTHTHTHTPKHRYGDDMNPNGDLQAMGEMER